MSIDLAALGLDSLVERNQTRRAVQKSRLLSRLDQKTAEDKAEEKAEKVWKAAVWKRDKGCCRVCGCKVNRSLELTPKRGEVHHCERRENKATRADVRNGVLLCAVHHQAITRNALFVFGSRTFKAKDGHRYLDATYPLTFKERK